MAMPQFNVELLSPVSTSVHLSVALRFSGEQGMIIELNNQHSNRNEYGLLGEDPNIRGFDVSWISRYGLEEDERYIIYLYQYSYYTIYPYTGFLLLFLCNQAFLRSPKTYRHYINPNNRGQFKFRRCNSTN